MQTLMAERPKHPSRKVSENISKSPKQRQSDGFEQEVLPGFRKELARKVSNTQKRYNTSV
jgi:hypothetical protein